MNVVKVTKTTLRHVPVIRRVYWSVAEKRKNKQEIRSTSTQQEFEFKVHEYQNPLKLRHFNDITL